MPRLRAPRPRYCSVRLDYLLQLGYLTRCPVALCAFVPARLRWFPVFSSFAGQRYVYLPCTRVVAVC